MSLPQSNLFITPPAPKRFLAPLQDWERALKERYNWQDPSQRSPTHAVPNLQSHPDLHVHVYETALGPIQVSQFNAAKHMQNKTVIPAEAHRHQPKSPILRDSDGDLEMSDDSKLEPSKQSEHVTFTPTQDAQIQSSAPTFPKSILRERVNKYELGPFDSVPESFEPDLSRYIEHNESYERQEAVRRERMQAFRSSLFHRPQPPALPAQPNSLGSILVDRLRKFDDKPRALEPLAPVPIKHHPRPEQQSLSSESRMDIAPFSLQGKFPSSLTHCLPGDLSSPTRKRKSPSSEELTLPQKVTSPPRRIITPIRRGQRPAATELYSNLSIDPEIRHPEPSQASEERTVRRFGGKMVNTFVEFLSGLFTRLVPFWSPFGSSFRTEEVEVIAVATDMSDKKRRAICRDTGMNTGMRTPTPDAEDFATMPGQFDQEEQAESNAQATEIDATTTSLAQRDVTRAADGIHSTPTKSTDTSASASSPRMATQKPEPTVDQSTAQSNITPPDSRPTSQDGDQAEASMRPRKLEVPLSVQIEHIERRAAGEQVPIEESYPILSGGWGKRANEPVLVSAPGTYRMTTPRPLPAPMKDRPSLKEILNKRRQNNQQADRGLENLLLRAKQAAAESPQERARKQRAFEEKQAKKAAEQAKAQAEQEKEEAKRAAAEAKALADKEEEEFDWDELAREEEERIRLEDEEVERATRQKSKDKLVRPLDPVWVARIEQAMSSTNGMKVLATTPEGTEITRRSLGKILPQRDSNGEFVESSMSGGDPNMRDIPGWLNDEAVNAFLSTIVASKLEQTGYVKGPNNVPAHVAYNTAWYLNYRSKGVQGIKTWSRRKGIQGEKLLRAERIFFPINTGAHWALIIICPQDRKIEFLDSAGGRKRPMFDFARKWLEMELGGKYNEEEWDEADSNSVLQLNFHDCGVFTCMNALASAKNRAFSEVPGTNGMEDARRMIVAVLLNGGFHGDWCL